MQVMIESELGTELWTHHNRIYSRVFSPSLPNMNGLDIVNVILTCYFSQFLFLYIVGLMIEKEILIGLKRKM